ncbi:helix-turn-helix domain-containing protein [Actinomycetes bacterium KLBMP 9759]
MERGSDDPENTERHSVWWEGGVDASAARSVRADVRRNRERLLAAARVVFARDGVGASLNDVARRAGVGPATLYRHFPTREALLEALLTGQYQALADRASVLSTSSTPLEALIEWLHAFIDHLATFRGLAVPVKAALQDERSAMHVSCVAMHACWQALVDRAKEASVVDPDVDALDLLRLGNAIAWAAEDQPDAGQVDRLLRMTTEGLRVRR